MNSTLTCEEFLMKATGLPLNQIIELYNAGHPWPLWTVHDIRKAGIIAQASGLLFPDVLDEVQAATDVQVNTILSTLKADDRAQGSVSVDERVQALTSLPWLKETEEHIEEVMARTRASRDVVGRLSLAIQHYALLNPGWELTASLPQIPRELFN